MGLGDWIMATAQVRDLNNRTGRRVAVVDRMNRPRWSEAFENNPRITQVLSPNVVRLLNAGGSRPYIEQKTATNWRWKRWDIKPGELFLTGAERDFGWRFSGAILIEPHTKVPGGNKAWPFERWQAVVDAMRDQRFVQAGTEGARVLKGVEFVQTTTRQVFGVINAVRQFVGSEGALHHAAAALGTPAVVLWSEFIHPAYTGYTSQINLRKADGICGSRTPCSGCRASMEAITVDEVVAALRGESKERVPVEAVA